MRSKVKAVNLHKSYKIDEAFAQGIASKILRMLKRENRVELELIFLDDNTIKKFNKKYKSENAPTDVLSFKIDRREFGQKIFLGEIMISLDTAFKNSEIFGVSFTEEIALYIIHGILHLFGYNDENPGDSLRMIKKQNQILERLCKCKDLSKVLMPR